MDVSFFSSHYIVRHLNEQDIPEIYQICLLNEFFYRYCPPFVSCESIRQDMLALPPGKEMKDKHYIGYYNQGQLIAVMDFIDGFPNEHTAFIGFFMLKKSLQKAGIGTSIIDELCAYLTHEGYKAIRLGWAKGNPQAEHFWHKNHFIETGVAYETHGYTVIVAQRQLSSK